MCFVNEKGIEKKWEYKGMPDENWLPEIVDLHLTALEAGWLTAALASRTINDVEVNVRGPNGEKVPSTMCRAIGAKLWKAYHEHD